jgi:hypothetical protein
MVQMLGWFSAEAACAFLWKRLRALGISGDFIGSGSYKLSQH